MSKIDAEGRAIASVSEESKLNEAIEWARDMAYAGFCNLSLDEEQRYENVANWLEDYKDYRNANFDLSQVADNRYKDGYAKAIDDFAEKIMEYCSMSDMNKKMIRQIAEQLKAGAVDG